MTAWALWLMPFLFSMSFVEAELLKSDNHRSQERSVCKSDTFILFFNVTFLYFGTA